MAGELKQECVNFDFTEQIADENEVRLKLFKPKLGHRSLSLADLIQLKEKCPLLRRFALSESDCELQQAVILCFGSVEDAMDFQEEERQQLTYSIALFQNQDFQNLEKTASLAYRSQKIYKQIDESGFCIKNGQIQLKKQTSVEELIIQTCTQELEEQSTLVNTERKISINEDLEKYREKELGEDEERDQGNVEKKNQGALKAFMDGVLVTGALLGGFKLLRYFMRF